MRISDWSSDVSSSDLFGTAAHQVDVIQPVRRVGDQAVGQALGDLGGEEAGVGVGQLVELVMQRRQHGRVAVPEAGHRGATRSVEIGLAVGVEDLAALGADSDRQRLMDGAMQDVGHALLLDLRSEEHTSELQSLMRISYAVFCL